MDDNSSTKALIRFVEVQNSSQRNSFGSCQYASTEVQDSHVDSEKARTTEYWD